MQTKIYQDAEELSRSYADWLKTTIAETLTHQDRFTIALSGGSTPKKLFKLLATEPYRSGIDWQKIHFFFGDERFVPFTDERNNARMAFDELLDKVPVIKGQVHIMDTSLKPADSVRHYEAVLHEYFPDGQSFDLVMLGLGDNSHTLSLFPGYSIVQEEHAWVSAFFLTEQDMFRISLTKVLVNQARLITYLVAGADKAAAVKAVTSGPWDPAQHPAQVIQSARGEVIWFLDRAAAGEVS